MYKTKEARGAADRKAWANLSPERKAARLAQCRAWNKANVEKRKTHAKYTPEERAEYMRKWRAKHPDKVRTYNAKTYENGGREYQAAYWERVKDGMREIRAAQGRAWREANPARAAANTARRRESVRQATPSWLTPDDHWLIGEIYDLCALRTRLTGVEHQVDHIYPLRGKTGCGLHVPTNLQVITAVENLRKRNHAPT